MSNKLTLSASDRINALLDDASFVEIGAYVKARNTDLTFRIRILQKMVLSPDMVLSMAI